MSPKRHFFNFFEGIVKFLVDKNLTHRRSNKEFSEKSSEIDEKIFPFALLEKNQIFLLFNSDQKMSSFVSEKPFETSKSIADGSFGEVYELKGDSNYVVKEQPLDFSMVETDILCKFDHPNILKATRLYLGTTGNEPDSLRNQMVLEKYTGPIFNLDIPNMETLSFVIKEIVSGVAFLHKHDIVHFDIKPGNILFSVKTGNIVVADFSISEYVSNLPLKRNVKMKQTAIYRQPENPWQANDTNPKRNCFLSDSWAVGMTILDLFCGQNAWWDIAISYLEKIGIDPYLADKMNRILKGKNVWDVVPTYEKILSFLDSHMEQKDCSLEILEELKTQLIRDVNRGNVAYDKTLHGKISQNILHSRRPRYRNFTATEIETVFDLLSKLLCRHQERKLLYELENSPLLSLPLNDGRVLETPEVPIDPSCVNNEVLRKQILYFIKERVLRGRIIHYNSLQLLYHAIDLFHRSIPLAQKSGDRFHFVHCIYTMALFFNFNLISNPYTTGEEDGFEKLFIADLADYEEAGIDLHEYVIEILKFCKGRLIFDTYFEHCTNNYAYSVLGLLFAYRCDYRKLNPERIARIIREQITVEKSQEYKMVGRIIDGESFSFISPRKITPKKDLDWTTLILTAVYTLKETSKLYAIENVIYYMDKILHALNNSEDAFYATAIILSRCLSIPKMEILNFFRFPEIERIDEEIIEIEKNLEINIEEFSGDNLKNVDKKILIEFGIRCADYQTFIQHNFATIYFQSKDKNGPLSKLVKKHWLYSKIQSST